MKAGDAVEVVAKPIAKTLDAIWGSDLQNCSKCGQMQTELNNASKFWDFYDAVKNRFTREEHADTG
jgi:hypothetical protein